MRQNQRWYIASNFCCDETEPRKLHLIHPPNNQKEGMATHSSIFAWRIPWTEEPGRLLQFTESQRVRHNWSNLAHMTQMLYMGKYIEIVFLHIHLSY